MVDGLQDATQRVTTQAQSTSSTAAIVLQTTTVAGNNVSVSMRQAPKSAPVAPLDAEKRPVKQQQQEQFDSSFEASVTTPPVPQRNTAWDGIDWSRGSNHKGSASTLSNCSSSDEDSSRSSIDLQEDLQQQDVELGVPPAAVQMNEPNNFFLPPYQRRRTSTVESLRQAEIVVNEENTAIVHEHLSDNDDNSQRPIPPPVSRSVNPRHVALARSQTRRNLLFLFLIALYTTFGLTQPTIPHVSREDDEFMQVSTTTTTTAETSLSPKETPAAVVVEQVVPKEESSLTARQQRKAVVGNHHLSFARKNSNPQLVYYRKQEVSDFYQQQAFKDEHVFSWYVSCGSLAAVALWAWRERRRASN